MRTPYFTRRDIMSVHCCVLGQQNSGKNKNKKRNGLNINVFAEINLSPEVT